MYKIKMLSLQDEDVLAEVTHKCLCLNRSRRPEVFLEISQIHRKTPVPESLLKKRLWPRCFPVNFAKFQRTPFVTEHFRWLLLSLRLRPSFSSCTNRWNTQCCSLWQKYLTPKIEVLNVLHE